MTMPAFTVAIIAGGQSRRMGQDKAFLELDGQALIDRVLERSAKRGQAETIIITNKPAAYAHLGQPMYGDALPNSGALGGIYTALLRARAPAVLALACDMPFLNRDLLRLLLGQLSADVDIIAPRVAGYPQALHAIYKKTCLPPIARQLAAGQLKIIRFYAQMRLLYLDEADYAACDPTGQSFTNLNTPAELAQAHSALQERAERQRA